MGVAQLWPMLRIQACEWETPYEYYYEFPTNTSISRFVKVLVIEIFSSVLGLFGLIIGLLLSSKAPAFEA